MDQEHTSDDRKTKPQPAAEDPETPPAIAPAQSHEEATRTHPKWLVPVATAILVVLVALTGFTGWRTHQSRQHETAFSACSQAAKTLQNLAGPSSVARYRDAATVQANQVKETKTVIAMSRAVKDAGGISPQIVKCDASMSASDLQAATDKTRDMNGRYRKLDQAAKAVLASRDAKNLDDAKTILASMRSEASGLLNDSDGKVADETTRDTLQKAIDQTDGVKGDKAKDYQDAANVLQSAIDQVNASMQQKAQADQANSQQQTSSNVSSGGHTPSPTNQAGSEGNWSVPAPTTHSEPQGGGVSDEINEWMHHIGKPVCQAGQACGIG